MKTNGFLFAILILWVALGNALAEELKPDNELKHPERVTIPNDVPFTTVVTGRLNKEDVERRSARVYPAIDYQMGHYKGWQQALSTVRDKGVAISKKPDPTRFVIATNSPTLIRGMEVGYRACLEICDNRLKLGESEEQLRHHCAAAYAPDGVPPPPPAKSNGSPAALPRMIPPM